MKYFIFIIKAILSIPILLFAIATYFGGAYFQTVSLMLIIVALFYWPFLKKKRLVSIFSRITFVVFMMALQFTIFKGEPKQSIYLSESLKKELYKVYDSKMAFWPDSTEQIFVETKYGKVHVLALGNKDNPPLLMFHAASMGAHSWAENLQPLRGRYRIYAIDNIGEGNLSELNDALIFPNTPKEIADLYADIANQLGVERSPVFGASNGGYIAQVYAYHYPEKVESLALFGPMGLTPLSAKSIFMLAAASLFPLDMVRDKVVHWAFGDDSYCHEKYGDWFDIIMKATIPSIAQPIPMTLEQKKTMDIPVILFLGTSDPIVGDAEVARLEAEYYPDIEIHTLNSGHIIAVEHKEFINQKIIEFLNL
jgi:pimeloyl-ACP methyl ester carboxylesterase